MANKKADSWNDKKQADKQQPQYQGSPSTQEDKSKNSKSGPCKNSLPT